MDITFVYGFVFYFLDFLVLLSPILLGSFRGFKVGLRSTIVWLPVILLHLLMFYFAMGCGHGSGNGGVCDFLTLIALGPQFIALVVFYLIYKKTGHNL
ncbi:MAG: hypothetical protein ACMZ63_08105 [Methylotenera sp.]